ncbi:MAG: class I tRNA ligase family protein [Candidatus Eisenbacteria bacterium]
MAEIPQRYDANEAESSRDQWQEWGIHRYDPDRPRDETFVIDTPPPTVSGSLHIGHVFSYTHQDLIARYQRMRGKNIHYGMGWDDNGLPTERLRVPRNYFESGAIPSFTSIRRGSPIRTRARTIRSRKCRGTTSSDAYRIVTREDEEVFERLWRKLGLSIDWSESYATIDDHCRRVSQLSFLDLVGKGHVYQIETPTMWDVDFKTAVAQAEVEDRERPGAMHELRFGGDRSRLGAEGSGRRAALTGEFRIATTRPELLASCIAVVAHPDDERYQPPYFGKTAVTPLFRGGSADPARGTRRPREGHRHPHSVHVRGCHGCRSSGGSSDRSFRSSR